MLEISISKDKKQFTVNIDKTQDYPFDANIFITDLNKDKNEEVFVSYGNYFTSGKTSQNIALFIKDLSGIYQKNFDVPGILPEALRYNYKGYPDLIIGGPWSSTPVWRWNGSRYKFLHFIEGKDPIGENIEDISKKYN